METHFHRASSAEAPVAVPEAIAEQVIDAVDHVLDAIDRVMELAVQAEPEAEEIAVH